MAKYQPLEWAKGTQPVWVPVELGLPLTDEIVLIQTRNKYNDGDGLTIGWLYDLSTMYCEEDYSPEERFGFECVEEYYGFEGFNCNNYPVAWCYLPELYDPNKENKTAEYFRSFELKDWDEIVKHKEKIRKKKERDEKNANKKTY